MKLFKNALIYDGTGADAFRGDILIKDDRIVKVEADITPEEEEQLLNGGHRLAYILNSIFDGK